MNSNHGMLDAAKAIRDQLVTDRRYIHAHPELAYNEVGTAAMVADRLTSLGIEVKTGVGGTGVVGLLVGAQPGKTVLLRADMDALPIVEVTERDYRSQNHGVMHACGHDGHTSMLLGAAKLLADRRDSIAGTVKFMFQPAEEGGFGAVKMIEAGLMDDPPVDGAFALHVDGIRYVGEVAVVAGPASAASDRFTVTVHGKGGHAARPHLTVDPILIASQIVVSLQTLVSREVSSTEQVVITVGSIHGGTAPNIIPDDAVIQGTLRTYNPEVRDLLQRRIGELCDGVARTMRGTVTYEFHPGYPSIVNDHGSTELVRRVIEETIGPGAAVDGEPVMGGEDFSYVLQNAPGMMFRLGVRDRSWEVPRQAHNSSFDMNEDALPIGCAVMAASAIEFLRRE